MTGFQLLSLCFEHSQLYRSVIENKLLLTNVTLHYKDDKNFISQVLFRTLQITKFNEHPANLFKLFKCFIEWIIRREWLLKDGSTLLIEATRGGHADVVNFLLNWTNPVHYQQVIPDELELSQSSPSQTSLDDQVKTIIDKCKSSLDNRLFVLYFRLLVEQLLSERNKLI